MNGDAWTSHQTVNSNIVATFHLGPASLTYPFFLIIYLYISTQFLFFLLSTGSSTRDPLFVSLLFLLSPPIIGSNSFRPEGRGRTVSIDDPTYPSWSVQWKKKKKRKERSERGGYFALGRIRNKGKRGTKKERRSNFYLRVCETITEPAPGLISPRSSIHFDTHG